MNDVNLKEVKHHQQLDLCKTRPTYRQGKKLTAVKVYTINNESQHLFVYGVPKINLRPELKNLCSKFGQVLNIHVITDYKTEVFTECYHVQYDRIQSARIAKRLIDNKSFYGGILHVCYAPEFESVQETKTKLLQRKRDVLTRLPNAAETNSGIKRKNSTDIDERDAKQFKNNEHKGKDIYEIYNEDDPILKRFNNVKEKSGSNLTCGPKISMKDYSELQTTVPDTPPNLIPSQVRVEKRIVFKKKN